MTSQLHNLVVSKSNKIPVLWLLVGLAWAAVLVLYSITSVDTLESFHYAHLQLLVFLIFVFFILRMASLTDARESMLLLYGVCYALFHFGIVPAYTVAPERLANLGFNLLWWYEDFQFVMASYFAATLFLAGYCSSLLVPMRGGVPLVNPSHQRSRLSKHAFVGLVISVLVWMALVFAAGYGAYDILLEQLHNSGRGGIIGVVHTAIGVTFIYAVTDPNIRRRTLLVYGVWSVLAFPVGLRGEVAFPIMIGFGIVAIQGSLKISLTRIVAISALFLALSSAVAVTRISTSNASFVGSVSMGKGIAELGGSIRPSFEVMRWLESGDTFRMGETYYAPFERLFLRVFPIWERLPANEDFRLTNIVIQERAGPYGFSISAEAFYNFGHVGVTFVGFLAGLVMRRFGRVAAKGTLPIFLTMITFGFFMHIRQAFVNAWGTVIIGIVLITALYFFKRLRAPEKK